jgi:catechol 2,3-dioxygenase-like lactoylglutathione lyase family enzyme
VKIKRLDRVEFMVRDFDRAAGLLADVFGLEYQRLIDPIAERDRVNSLVCHPLNLHFVSPMLPISNGTPPPMAETAGLLDRHPAILLGISFLVDNLDQARKELPAKGIALQSRRYEQSPDYVSVGMDRFEEILSDPEGTLGLLVSFSSYDLLTCPPRETRTPALVKGLDRFVIMVRDMDKALSLFSGKLGMRFLKLDDSISERDHVVSYVCPETHLHLIAPIYPVAKGTPPPMLKKIDSLKEHEAIFQALTFLVDDIAAAERALTDHGIRVQKHRYAKSHDYSSIGMDNFEEIMTEEDDSLGILMGFAKYDAP